MRVAISSFGSEGDIRPILALGRRLRERGHEAWVVASSVYARRAAEAGVPLRQAGPSMEPELFTARVRAEMPAVLRERNPVRQARLVYASAAPDLRAGMPHVLEALRDADLVVHGMGDISAFAAALALGKPRVSVHFFHSLLPASRAMPDGASYGPLLNRLLVGTTRRMVGVLTDGMFQELLALAGVPPRRNILIESATSPLLNLLAVSPSLVPADPAWGERVVQTGYWFLDSTGYVPPPALTAFLEAGERPLVVTFGSMAGMDVERVTRMVGEAAQQVGCRVVLQSGWAGLGAGALPPHMLGVDYVPHDWLFPRAAAVLHHGGAGTTAAALRAGLPQAVVWHLGDQPTWGKLLARRGLAPGAPVSHRKLSADWLVRTMRALLTQASLRERAAELGARIRAEDGTARAAEALEKRGQATFR